MIKNYLKIALILFKRKKLLTLISLYGIVMPMLFIILIFSFLNHINNFQPPFSKGKKIFFLDMIMWIEHDKTGKQIRNMGNPPNYNFICKHLKTMKTPKMVSAISSTNSQNYVYKNGIKKQLTVRYTDSEFWQITDHLFICGKPYTLKDVEKGQQLAVIDLQTAEYYFGKQDVIGKTVTFNNKTYTINGVIKNVDVTSYRISSNVYLPISTNPAYKQESIFEAGCYALIEGKSEKDMDKINNEFQSIIKKYDYSNSDGCNAMVAQIEKPGFFAELNMSVFFLFNVWTEAYYKISIVLCILFFFLLPAFNLVNINLNRIYERQTEIGIRKSFGSASNNLLSQFLTETIILTFIGGLISIVLATFFLHLLNISTIFPGTLFVIDFKVFIFTFLAILLFSIFSGIYPAWKMSRINIVNSLNDSAL